MRERRESNPARNLWAIERRQGAGFVLSESTSEVAMDVLAHSHGEPHVTVVLEGVCRETNLGRMKIGGTGY
jgi:hypothetical protein